jgi:hypothetical protein
MEILVLLPLSLLMYALTIAVVYANARYAVMLGALFTGLLVSSREPLAILPGGAVPAGVLAGLFVRFGVPAIRALLARARTRRVALPRAVLVRKGESL